MTLSSADVANHRPTVVRMRQGYACAAVDHFLSQVVTTLQAWEQASLLGRAPARTSTPLSVNDVRNVTFPATKFRQGYEQEEVDALLDDVARTLTQWVPTGDGAQAGSE